MRASKPLPADGLGMSSPLAPARRWVRDSYYLSTAAETLKGIVRPVYRTNPLIVYQMGKVGSEALEHSLALSDFDRPVLRVHAMVEANIRDGLARVNLTPKEYFKRTRIDFEGLCLGREVRRDLRKHCWQVLTMVRDPVAQNVSAFFQTLDIQIPDFERRIAHHEIAVDELMERFVAEFPPDNLYVRWFETELFRMFEVDLYEQDFDWSRGYTRYSFPQLDLMVIRLEDLSRVASAAMTGFLGLDAFHLKRKNEASGKVYSDLYQRFLTEAVFPRSYVEGVYESKYARHFYSQSEREAFAARLRLSD